MMQCWDQFRAAISTEFRDHREDFLRQPTFTRTMHPNQPDLAAKYWCALHNSELGSALIRRAKDAEFGKPRRHHEGCSMVALQHAWQICNLVDRLGVRPTDLRQISEIGGGYGDMCRQLRTAAFYGNYTIFDFPELHQVQKHYLERSITAPASLEVLTPENLRSGFDASLLIATFSVSEMPLALRADLEPAFMGYQYLMMSWNSSFAGIDNMAWFSELIARLRQQFTIDLQKDPFMSAWYIYGRRR